jgi:hypothetical protein
MTTIQNTIKEAFDKRDRNFLNGSDWTQNLPEDFRNEMKSIWFDHPNNKSFGQFLFNLMNMND